MQDLQLDPSPAPSSRALLARLGPCHGLWAPTGRAVPPPPSQRPALTHTWSLQWKLTPTHAPSTALGAGSGKLGKRTFSRWEISNNLELAIERDLPFLTTASVQPSLEQLSCEYWGQNILFPSALMQWNKVNVAFGNTRGISDNGFL